MAAPEGLPISCSNLFVSASSAPPDCLTSVGHGKQQQQQPPVDVENGITAWGMNACGF